MLDFYGIFESAIKAISSHRVNGSFAQAVAEDWIVTAISSTITFVLGLSFGWMYKEITSSICLRRMFGREHQQFSIFSFLRKHFPKTEINIVIPRWWAPDGIMALNDFVNGGRNKHKFRGPPEFIANCDGEALFAVTNALEDLNGVKTRMRLDGFTDGGDNYLVGKNILIGSTTSNSWVHRIFHKYETPEIRKTLSEDILSSHYLSMSGHGRVAAENLAFTIMASDDDPYEMDDHWEYACIYKCRKPFDEAKIKNVIIIAGQLGYGTTRAAKYFAENYKSLFKGGKVGVLLEIERRNEENALGAMQDGRINRVIPIHKNARLWGPFRKILSRRRAKDMVREHVPANDIEERVAN